MKLSICALVIFGILGFWGLEEGEAGVNDCGQPEPVGVSGMGQGVVPPQLTDPCATPVRVAPQPRSVDDDGQPEPIPCIRLLGCSVCPGTIPPGEIGVSVGAPLLLLLGLVTVRRVRR